MTEEERFARGREIFDRCYGGIISLPDEIGPADMDGMTGITVRNLFNDIWGRPGLSFRDRRLLILGALAGLGADPSLFTIHVRSALHNGEIQPAELPEFVLTLLPYIGYPKTTPLNKVVETCIAEHARAGRDTGN